jgi:hypothetical protein
MIQKVHELLRSLKTIDWQKILIKREISLRFPKVFQFFFQGFELGEFLKIIIIKRFNSLIVVQNLANADDDAVSKLDFFGLYFRRLKKRRIFGPKFQTLNSTFLHTFFACNGGFCSYNLMLASF